MLVFLRRSLHPRAAALLTVAAVLCALGVEVQAAMMGHLSHQGHAPAVDAAAAGHHHVDCNTALDHGGPAGETAAGCCHHVACPASAVLMPAPQADDAPAAVGHAPATGSVGALDGLRHAPPLRPPR